MTDGDGVWGWLEQRRETAFLVGGLVMVVDAGLVAANIATGTEAFLLLGQAFVGAAWTVALLGLLGLYPDFAGRSRWLSRFGAVFAGIGVVVFAVMAVTVLAYYAGIPAGTYDDVGVLFIPGVLVGSVLGFVTFSLASLRSDVHSRSVGVLLLLPPVLVLTNILRFAVGMESVTITLGVVVLDALAMLAIGYVLQSEAPLADHADPTPDSTAR